MQRREPSLRIDWCSDPAEISELARFFVENVDPSYISHGEMQQGRALDPDHWVPALEQSLRDEMAAALRTPESGRRFFSARIEGEMAGFGMVLFEADALPPYAVLDDLVVAASERSKGIGAEILAWVEQEAKAASCRRIFLESGIHNQRAHHFFEAAGFRTCSVVMLKQI